PLRQSLDPYPTRYAAAPAAPIVVGGGLLVYLASEASTGPTGTDLNGDGDTLDDVAVSVRLGSGTEQSLGVATREAAILSDVIYLVADETQDGVDWDGDVMLSSVVLLHWSQSSGAMAFVDTLRPSSAVRYLFGAGAAL